jgi:hypothetical protein
MELPGFILLFMGLIYVVYPKINSLWPTKDAEAKNKMLTKEYLKTIRLGGLIAAGVGAALLIANCMFK